MKRPREWNPVEIYLWREEVELKRLREGVLGSLNLGRDIGELSWNEGIEEDEDE